MKGYAVAATPAKRRWKGLAVGVLALVVFSLLVPLVFILGLNNNRYFADERSRPESSFFTYRNLSKHSKQDPSEVNQSKFQDLVNKLVTNLPEDNTKNTLARSDDDLHKKTNSQPTPKQKNVTDHFVLENFIPKPKGPVIDQIVSRNTRSASGNDKKNGNDNDVKHSTIDERENYCQLEFGSYCLWSREHKEVLKDSLVKRLKDQLFMARAYYPSIAKLQGKEKFTRVLKLNIQEHERMLSEAISDPDLPAHVGHNIRKMDETITKAKSCPVECQNVDRKFRQLVDLTEDEAHFHMKQSSFLYQLGIQTMSKSFHCLLMRLTVEYFKTSVPDIEQSHGHKLHDPSSLHFVIFSTNILAVSVTINSTVMNTYDTGNIVFHVITDRQNFFSMKVWFARNSYKDAIVHVLNFDDLNLISFDNMGKPQLLPSEEFRVSVHSVAQHSLQMRTEYISIFGDSHFFLPEIFKYLKKVIILDDDVVVQRDLSSLWNLDLGGKVNAAAKFCSVRLGQLKAYLGSNKFDSQSCAWMSGFNIVDLDKWREYDITGMYQRFLRELRHDKASQRATTLPASLLAFQDHIYALDDTWVQSGLGHNYRVDTGFMTNAIALHYNGNMKPWLDLGIPKYKKYWKKYLTKEERFMDECNVNL